MADALRCGEDAPSGSVDVRMTRGTYDAVEVRLLVGKTCSHGGRTMETNLAWCWMCSAILGVQNGMLTATPEKTVRLVSVRQKPSPC